MLKLVKKGAIVMSWRLQIRLW